MERDPNDFIEPPSILQVLESAIKDHIPRNTIAIFRCDPGTEGQVSRAIMANKAMFDHYNISAIAVSKNIEVQVIQAGTPPDSIAVKPALENLNG